MSDKVQNMIFHCLVASTCVVILYLLKTPQDHLIKAFLYPHAKMTEIFYNISLTYIPKTGYSSTDGSFAVTPACLGGKFITLLFAMNACMFVKYFKGIGKIAWFLISLIGAGFLGILISCIRIIGSIPFVSHQKFALFHSSIGISSYFFTLILSYSALKKLFRSDRNEKSI